MKLPYIVPNFSLKIGILDSYSYRKFISHFQRENWRFARNNIRTTIRNNLHPSKNETLYVHKQQQLARKKNQFYSAETSIFYREKTCAINLCLEYMSRNQIGGLRRSRSKFVNLQRARHCIVTYRSRRSASRRQHTRVCLRRSELSR